MPFQISSAPELVTFDIYTKRDSAPSKDWAYTKSNITPSGLAPLTRPGGVSVASSFTVTVSLNRAQSWVLKAHLNDTKLLDHKRLHHMIACCVGLKFYNEAIALVKPKLAALQTELTRAQAEADVLFKAMTRKYDADTGSNTIASQQAAWATRIRGWYASKKLTL
jgi:hypothetical protein